MPPEIPRTMKAVLLKGSGGFDRLEYREDVETPAPAEGEVLIRVGAAGVNNTDINTRAGWYSKSVTEGTDPSAAASGFSEAKIEGSGWTGGTPVFPRIQGADACGRIISVGPNVDPIRLGERVLVEPVFHVPAASSRAIYFGSEWDGAFAEFAKAPANHAHKISSPLSDVELASFPCAYSAAENMLTRAGLRAGETILITGASGGVGSAAVQLAKRRGATVLAVCAASKAAFVASLGASRVASSAGDLVDEVGRAALDVVVDVVGGPQFPKLLETLRPGGRLAVAGAIGGPMIELDLRTLYLKDLRLYGCTILAKEVFANLIGYIERGEIKPIVAKTFPLSAIVEAQKEFIAKRQTGKIVLTPC